MTFTCEQCGYFTQTKCNLKKHTNRKTKCGETKQTKQNNVVNPCDFSSEEKDELNVKCTACDKTLRKRNFTNHTRTCRGVSKDACMYCLTRFDIQQSRSRHQKTCKLNPLNNHGKFATVKVDTQPATIPNNMMTGNITNNNNNIIDNSINIDNSIVNNITVVNFGNENINLLMNSEDPRLKSACKYILDTIDLVHFNVAHPENQNVRKLNKKSNLMEFRTNDRWEHESCTTGLPKLRQNLEFQLNAKFEEELIPDPSLKEFLYHKSKRGVVVQEDILEKFNPVVENLEQLNVQRCMTECDKVATQEVKRMKQICPNGLCTPIFVDNLFKMVNEVRVRYEEEPFTEIRKVFTYIKPHLSS